ncbi:MAG: hypothetical protein H7240_00465 [Glaciimonas sp.]|nr:hypothetical protein [Glaciimonas sp.]
MFPIIFVPPDAAEFFEKMRTKRKFWYNDHLLRKTLFKEAHPGNGENWPEKLARELATLLDLHHT